MANHNYEILDSVGVPSDTHNPDSEYDLLERNVCFPSARTPQRPLHQDEVYISGQYRIGLGICPVCQDAPNNCVIVSGVPGLPSCGHLICATCVEEIMAKGDRTCPLCRRYIARSIPINVIEVFQEEH